MDSKLCNVYEQYHGTNVEKFIKGLCSISNYYTKLSQNTLTNYLDLHKSYGTALDSVGKLLNFNRYITFNDPLDVVIAKTPGIDEYEVLYDDFKKCRLNDDSYRKILTIILQTQNTVASVTTLTKIISEAVGADVFVGDAMDMRYITYYFLDLIPGWLEVSMHNYDILPRPAGMAVQYISAISRFFGFLIDKPEIDYEETAKVFTSFWKSRFPESQIGIRHLPYDKIMPPLQGYELVNLTDEQLMNLNIEIANKKQTELAIRHEFFERQKTINDHLANDKSQLNKFKDWIGTSFGLYSSILSEELTDNDRMKKMYIPYYNQLRALHRHRTLNLWRDTNKQLTDLKEDPRTNLFYDRKSGWYFYKDADSSGNFKPEYQANLYQDDCGLWFPQDPFEWQIIHKKIELRHWNYANNKRTKVLNDPTTSPFYKKYSYIFDNITTNDDRQALIYVVETMHQAAKLWRQANLIDKSSFRAIFDFEFKNASMIQYRNHLRDSNLYSSNPGETEYDKKYWKYIYDKLNEYYGYNRNYRDSWNDYDTNAPVYKRKMFIKYQRYLVINTKNKLNDLYSSAYNRWNKISNKPDNAYNLYYVINEMATDLNQEYWTDYEQSKTYGAGYKEYDSWYNQINNKNDKIQVDSSWNWDRYEKLKKAVYAYEQAENSCRILKGKCDRGESTQGQHWQGWYCFLKDGLEDDPDYDHNKFNGNISWNAGSYWTNESRLCYNPTDGYSSKVEQFINVQRRNQQAAKEKRDIAWKKHYQAHYETQVRTLVTQDRTLRDILNVYNSYVPSELVEKPDGPIIDIEYPDWTLPSEIPNH